MRLAVPLALVLLAGQARAQTPEPETLPFDIREGDIHNHFFRHAAVAAHLLTTSAAAPPVLAAAAGRRLVVRLTALADDEPLTPVPLGALLRSGTVGSPRDRQALAFLSYEEKLLAGSWRFLTYFGRDTLLSLRLLMPALRP